MRLNAHLLLLDFSHNNRLKLGKKKKNSKNKIICLLHIFITIFLIRILFVVLFFLYLLLFNIDE